MLTKRTSYRIFLFSLILSFSSLAFSSERENDARFENPNPLLRDVKIIPSSFSPSLNQKTEISYHLRQNAVLTVHILGPEGELIRVLIENTERVAGNHKEIWDGKDKNDEVVPDEAYSFVIKAVDNSGYKETFTPSVSQWKRFDTSAMKLSKRTNTIRYELSKPCRTRIRVGIENGPLLRTLLDWCPKIAGEIMVHWDGWDENRVINIWKHPKAKIVISNMELPGHIIITYGNKKTDYIKYRQPGNSHQARDGKQSQDEFRGSVTTPAPLATLLSPRLKISFPMTKQFTPDGIPILSQKTLVRIEVENKAVLAKVPYEIIFFIDGTFYSEEPSGISPYNWVWDVSNVKSGEHLFTVNLVSFGDQIGVSNKKIRIE